MVFYSDMDYRNYNKEKRKCLYKYISGTNDFYGVGIAWNKHKEPIFIIERVEDALVEEGDSYNPPIYEPEGIETIIVKPQLRRL
jgi:hypothetical protein